MLTSREQERYDRQIMIGGIGQEGKRSLNDPCGYCRAGGLGCPIAIYLVAAESE